VTSIEGNVEKMTTEALLAQYENLIDLVDNIGCFGRRDLLRILEIERELHNREEQGQEE
jgi:hypothetical protein